MTALLEGLVNGALLSAPIAVMVWLALRLAPRRRWNAATRYAVWWAVLLVTVLLPALFLPPAPQPRLLPPAYVAAAENAVGSAPELAVVPSRIVSTAIDLPVREASAASRVHLPRFPIRISDVHRARWIPLCWLSLSGLMLLRLAISWLQLHRYSLRAVDPPEALRGRVDGWLKLCRSRRRGVRLAISAEIAMPAAVGPVRPSILIPARLFAEMDECALDQIGLHESAHLARRDDYALLTQRILEAIFMLHPVARWIGRQIDLEREIACDDFVLAAGESLSYASCLTRVVELSAGVHLPMAAAATGSRSQFVQRVELLLDKTRHTGTRLLKVRLVAAVSVLAAMAWMAARVPGVLAFGTPGGIALQMLLPRLAAPLFFPHATEQQPAQPAAAPPAQPATPSKPEDLASVEGRVTNGVTGEPVRKASVVFRAPTGIFMASTDESGRYQAARLDPDSYTLMVTRNGFLTEYYGASDGQKNATPIALSAGQKRTGVDFKLSPQGLIAGRVLNSDGEPMVNQIVAPMGIRYLTGKRELFPSGSTVTNDLGEYRLPGLRPGRYFVFVHKSSGSARGPAASVVDRSAHPKEEDYLDTYYPGVADALTAAPVDVAPGIPSEGIDIKLVRAHVTHVSGHVTNRSGLATAPIVTLVSAATSAFSGPTTRPDSQGQFEFRGVSPGSYAVRAEIYGRAPLRAEQTVVVGNDPVENVALILTPGAEIPGNVRVDDGTLDLHSIKIYIRTQWLRDGNPTPEATPDDDGNFKLSSVNPYRYIVAIDNLPDGFYLKSARMGARDVWERGFDLIHESAAPLQLVISGKAGGVSGRVLDRNEAPVSRALVALAPREMNRQGQQPFYRSMETDASGTYKWKNLPPGEYRLFAWEEVEERAWVDADFLKPYEAQSKMLTVSEGSSDVFDIRVIARGSK